MQLVTNGLKLTDFRPAGADDAVDIRLRLPEDRRTFATLDSLRIETAAGLGADRQLRPAHPGAHHRHPDPHRRPAHGDGRGRHPRRRPGRPGAPGGGRGGRTGWTSTPQGIRWKMAGEDEEQKAAGAFLANAFLAAVALIFAVLLAQFNNFVSVFLVLSAVVMSTIGVFLGLLIMGQPFGIVMTGIGIIALAGVVVNNNIVLIDTYDQLRNEGAAKIPAILQTCRERARPVVLTAATAILGVLPIAFGLNLELMNHETTIGAPSTQWWISLSSAIVFGLAFSTVLTLVVTPSMLMLFTRERPVPGTPPRRSRIGRLFRGAARSAPAGE